MNVTYTRHRILCFIQKRFLSHKIYGFYHKKDNIILIHDYENTYMRSITNKNEINIFPISTF